MEVINQLKNTFKGKLKKNAFRKIPDPSKISLNGASGSNRIPALPDV